MRSATNAPSAIIASVHTHSRSVALRPFWGQSANSANTSRYSSVLFAPSQAFAGTAAQAIEQKLSAVYAARHADGELDRQRNLAHAQRARPPA